MISVYFQLEQSDAPYLFRLKKILQGRVNGTISSNPFTVATEVAMNAKRKGAKFIATTSPKLLNMLLGNPSTRATLNDYAGSIIKFADCEFLILNPLEHFITNSAADFLYRRYFDKFISPEKFIKIPEFSWSLFREEDTAHWLQIAETCSFSAHDIETGREIDRFITCIGFTFVNISSVDRSYTLQTLVVPFTSKYNIKFVELILSFEPYKVTQNGKYDHAYLLRYHIPVYNWLGDTAHLFHSWYSELPKRLDFITSFCLRDWAFWKDESKTSDDMEYYQYNAKDSFTTALVWLALLIEATDWAINNYTDEFPLVFPCLLCEMVGVKRDAEFFDKELARFQKTLEERRKLLGTMVDNSSFNPGSHVQVKNVFIALGSEDIKDTKPPSMDKVKHRHAFNARIIEEIIKYRKDQKLEGSYLRDEIPEAKPWEVKTKSWFNRILYSLNPHGTDTTRLACKESAFWCGWNFQTVPRDRDDIQIKEGIISDSDFFFGEGDYSQNETWGTAYLSGDAALIEAIEDRSKDFHGRNASAFFGLPYEEIVDTKQLEDGIWFHKTIAKAIRDTSKRTNHGANYNMTAPILLATMGIDAVVKAKKLLKLPSNWSLLKVCGYLLLRFDETYPVVRGAYYDKIRADIATTNMLVGPTGLTRYCFGNPSSNKRDMNRYAAHGAQSLGAQELNKAFLKVFHNVYLPNPKDFKLHAQIHDSILFSYRKGRIDLAYKVKEEMRVPIDVTDIYGTVHNMVVPVDLKGEGDRWSNLRSLQ